MGSGENGTPAKSYKPPSSMQEAHTMPGYPDWSSSMQAFYGAGATPPFFASTSASSPTPHPFLWRGQHHLMSPYGTPVYPAMYPPGGVYAHPNMVTNSGNVHGNAEMDGKATEGKDLARSEKIKGNLGNHGLVGAKPIDGVKATSGSGNDAGTQSTDSRSQGSSDASGDNQIFAMTKKGSFDQMLADAANAQNNGVQPNLQTSVAGNPVVSGSKTNLNIGMDLWNGSGPNRAEFSPSVVAPGGMSDQWVQNERELKRQKRKQSNRESARRSRLRKQAECEELQVRVEKLSNENLTLRDELQRLAEECEKVSSENISIKEELTKLYGPDIVSRFEEGNC
ncbi:G-box binding factor [Castilleja foliolosa]|uniref:G-box binding factor n=1 Tax=Castilleja foliolosa TaxID=1961234 RepID=A0ABD3CP15_9LAMI